MLTTLLAASLATSSAFAGGRDAVSLMVGTSTAFDDDPATLRLSFRGELGLREGKLLGAYLLLPVTLSWQGEDSVGLQVDRTLVEVPISLRARLLPNGPLRIYGDIGVGAAFGSGWIVRDPDAGIVWMSRLALGAEFGDADKWMIGLEPFSGATYGALADSGDRLRGRYGLMVGIVVTL